MPYLRIKVTDNNKNSDDWVTINDLNLNKLTIESGGTLTNKGTISGGTISGSTISGSTIQSTSADQSKKIEIKEGTLSIGGQDLDTYLTTKTSACSIWKEGTMPTPAKEGDLLIEKRNNYNLLWYCEKGTNGQLSWKQVHAIWG